MFYTLLPGFLQHTFNICGRTPIYDGLGKLYVNEKHST